MNYFRQYEKINVPIRTLQMENAKITGVRIGRYYERSNCFSFDLDLSTEHSTVVFNLMWNSEGPINDNYDTLMKDKIMRTMFNLMYDTKVMTISSLIGQEVVTIWNGCSLEGFRLGKLDSKITERNTELDKLKDKVEDLKKDFINQCEVLYSKIENIEEDCE